MLMLFFLLITGFELNALYLWIIKLNVLNLQSNPLSLSWLDFTKQHPPVGIPRT